MPVRAATAFSELYEAHHPRMLRAAAGLLRDPEAAEDVVHDAFLALYANWERVDDPAGYLHRSVVNGARSRLRRKSVTQRLAAFWSSAPSAEESALAGVVAQPVLEALRNLPRREREAVLFRYYLDLSEQQAADALGVRVGSVKGYASRGLKTLRAALVAVVLVVLAVLGGRFAADRLTNAPTQPAGVPSVTVPATTVPPATDPVSTPRPTPTIGPTAAPTSRATPGARRTR